jgi:hypothetical protein
MSQGNVYNRNWLLESSHHQPRCQLVKFRVMCCLNIELAQGRSCCSRRFRCFREAGRVTIISCSADFGLGLSESSADSNPEPVPEWEPPESNSTTTSTCRGGNFFITAAIFADRSVAHTNSPNKASVMAYCGVRFMPGCLRFLTYTCKRGWRERSVLLGVLGLYIWTSKNDRKQGLCKGSVLVLQHVCVTYHFRLCIVNLRWVQEQRVHLV